MSVRYRTVYMDDTIYDLIISILFIDKANKALLTLFLQSPPSILFLGFLSFFSSKVPYLPYSTFLFPLPSFLLKSIIYTYLYILYSSYCKKKLISLDIIKKTILYQEESDNYELN